MQLIGLRRRGLPVWFSIICIGARDPVSNPGVGNIVSMARGTIDIIIIYATWLPM